MWNNRSLLWFTKIDVKIYNVFLVLTCAGLHQVSKVTEGVPSLRGHGTTLFELFLFNQISYVSDCWHRIVGSTATGGGWLRLGHHIF